MIELDLTSYNLIALSTSGGTINHILFLYWNHQISRKQTLEYLADIPSDILAEWIDDLVNRVNEAMSFATLADRLDYPDGRPLPVGEIHGRILEAAKSFCFKGSIKNWTAGMTMKARDEGLIEDYEYWTAERIANDMAEKARAGKRKLY